MILRPKLPRQIIVKNPYFPQQLLVGLPRLPPHNSYDHTKNTHLRPTSEHWWNQITRTSPSQNAWSILNLAWPVMLYLLSKILLGCCAGCMVYRVMIWADGWHGRELLLLRYGSFSAVKFIKSSALIVRPDELPPVVTGDYCALHMKRF